MEEINRNNEILKENNKKLKELWFQLSSITGINQSHQSHPHCYDRDPKIKHAIGVKPFTPCGEN